MLRGSAIGLGFSGRIDLHSDVNGVFPLAVGGNEIDRQQNALYANIVTPEFKPQYLQVLGKGFGTRFGEYPNYISDGIPHIDTLLHQAEMVAELPVNTNGRKNAVWVCGAIDPADLHKYIEDKAEFIDIIGLQAGLERGGFNTMFE